jgi:hypothetical protein
LSPRWVKCSLFELFLHLKTKHIWLFLTEG